MPERSVELCLAQLAELEDISTHHLVQHRVAVLVNLDRVHAILELEDDFCRCTADGVAGHVINDAVVETMPRERAEFLVERF